MAGLKNITGVILPLCFFASGCEVPERETFPSAKKIIVAKESHGFHWYDAYAHLSNLDSPLAQDYLAQEAAYFDDQIEPLESLIDALSRELNSNLPRTLSSKGFREGDFDWFSSVTSGNQYRTFTRQHIKTGKKDLVLDLNSVASDSPYFKLGHLDTSPNHKYVAYSEDRTGRGRYSLVLVNILTREIYRLADDLDPRFAWLGSKIVCSDTNSGEVRLVGLNSQNKVIFAENNRGASIEIHQSERETPIIISNTIDSTEIHLVTEDAKVEIVRAREPGHRYRIKFHENKLFALSNLKNPSFDLAEIPFEGSSKTDWKFLNLQAGGTIFDFDLTSKGFLLHTRARLREQIKLIGWKNSETLIADAGAGESLGLHSIVDGQLVNFWRRDLRRADNLYQFDLASNQQELAEATYQSDEFESSLFDVKEFWFAARDGVQVPISLFYKKGPKLADRPVFVSAYGAYGLTRPPRFNPSLLPLLDRGFLVADVYVRGGGELGREWHEAGRAINKIKGLEDLADGINALQKNEFGDPTKFVLGGRSAGGTLAAHVANEHPALINTVVLENAFLDIVNTLIDDSSANVERDRIEWGDPRDRDIFFAQYAYSPYEHIKNQVYPNLLVMASKFDNRVGAQESIKWVAKLREFNGNRTKVLFDLDELSGHGGPTDQYLRRRKEAIKYAFMIKAVGAEKRI